MCVHSNSYVINTINAVEKTQLNSCLVIFYSGRHVSVYCIVNMELYL